MAKDRAKDPKRVPSLGISDPISHVRPMSQGETAMKLHLSDNSTQKQYNDERTHELKSIKNGMYAKSGGKHIDFLNKIADERPETIKVNSNPAKGK